MHRHCVTGLGVTSCDTETGTQLQRECKGGILEVQFFRRLAYYGAWGGFKPTFRDYLSDPSSRAKLSKKMAE